jgi:hypothetical protein
VEEVQSSKGKKMAAKDAGSDEEDIAEVKADLVLNLSSRDFYQDDDENADLMDDDAADDGNRDDDDDDDDGEGAKALQKSSDDDDDAFAAAARATHDQDGIEMFDEEELVRILAR